MMKTLPIAARLFLFALAFGFSGFALPAIAADAGEPPARTDNVIIPQFDIQILQRPGPIVTADSGDFDGDGKTDLLLFHKPSKESYEKSCAVLFQHNGKFSEKRLLDVPLGDTTSAIDVKDIDSDGADEVCAFDGGGMVVFRMSGGSSRALAFSTLLPATARQIAGVNWIADVDSDDRADVVLPAPDGLHLFLQKKNGTFEQVKRYDAPIRASVSTDIGQSYVNYRLPTLEFADFDGDGRKDIGAFDFEQMTFFLSDGSFPPSRMVASPLVRKFTKEFIGATEFRDLNADHVPDAVLVLMSQKKNLQSEARIYFGKADLSYGDEPGNAYTGETNVILPMFLDVTGNGKMEMLLQNVNVGFGFFLNYFLRNRVRVDAELRRLGEDGKYEQDPVARRAIYIRASETGTEPARGVGDFNGDGLDDLVVGIEENRLAFFLSNTEDFLPRQPSFELDVPAYGKLYTLDLNGDSRTDIVILYPQEDKLNRATLILSK